MLADRLAVVVVLDLGAARDLGAVRAVRLVELLAEVSAGRLVEPPHLERGEVTRVIVTHWPSGLQME